MPDNKVFAGTDRDIKEIKQTHMLTKISKSTHRRRDLIFGIIKALEGLSVVKATRLPYRETSIIPTLAAQYNITMYYYMWAS
jgi:hypothetical protein